jgi:endonuclease/exonuclease/phosphatase family metal-dependent hydrolase
MHFHVPDRIRWPASYRRIGLCAALLAATGCTTHPAPRIATCLPDGAGPTVTVAGPGASATFDVLTFNIEGLGWPARRNRAPSLARIGALLADLNRRGQAPDVILLQEAFSQAAVDAVDRAGYSNSVWGPSRTQRQRLPADARMPGPFRWTKGETGFHLVSSGLAILSRYPIVADALEPFGKHRCAGFDCLSNKGIQHARIVIPGVPRPIDVYNTHLNAQGASRVPASRSGAAHAMQVASIARFVAATRAAGGATVLGGDFNMRGSAKRMQRFEAQIGDMTLVHHYCAAPANRCAVSISWDGDAPWMDTEDLQLFGNGRQVRIEPIAVEAMFDGSKGSPQLSDHDGFRVRYRLSWPRHVEDGSPAAPMLRRCGAAR